MENYFCMTTRNCKDCKDSINFFIYFLLKSVDREVYSRSENDIIIV